MSTGRPKLAIIAAVGDNFVIGYKGKLAWRLPVDWAHFKRHTKNKTLIMGRVTFDSLGEPLKDRVHIVISRKANSAKTADEQVTWVTTIEQAVDTAYTIEAKKSIPNTEIMILGGSAIYEKTLTMADILYITRVHFSPVGDAYFPDWTGPQYANRFIRTAVREAVDTTNSRKTILTFETWKKRV